MNRQIILLIFLLSINIVYAGSIEQTDSYGAIYELDCGDSCGSYTDGYLWVGYDGCFEYKNPGTFVDIVCVDVLDDGDLESCIYDDSAKMSDCIAEYVAVDDVNTAYNYDVGDLNGGGWGTYDCSGSVSMGATYLISSSVSIAGAVDSDTPRSDLRLRFYEYYDCDDSDGERDVNSFDLEEYQIFNKKGALCIDDNYRHYGFTPDDSSHLLSSTYACFFEDIYSGDDLSYCDVSKLYNSSDADEDLDGGYCSLNFTIRDEYLNNRRFNCYNGVLDSNLNESGIDWGGWCGNCSPFFVDDVSFELAGVAFDAENGRRTINNPFDASYCPVGDAVGVVPIIIFLSITAISLLLLFVAGVIIILYVFGIFALTQAIRGIYRKYYKNKK